MTLFWGELKRRNVVRVAIAYAVVSWLLLQLADVVLDNIEAPTWVFQATLLLLVIGFPVAIIFAWAFELTPEGLKKEKDINRSESITHVTGRKLDYLIIAALVLALGFFTFDKFVLGPSRDAELVQATTESRKSKIPDKSIAVLPFVNMSDDPGNEYFSDGIAEELLNVLIKVEGLRVVSRTSSFAFKGKDVSIPNIARELNVNYVLEGSVRKAGNTVRVVSRHLPRFPCEVCVHIAGRNDPLATLPRRRFERIRETPQLTPMCDRLRGDATGSGCLRCIVTDGRAFALKRPQVGRDCFVQLDQPRHRRVGGEPLVFGDEFGACHGDGSEMFTRITFCNPLRRRWARCRHRTEQYWLSRRFG